MTKRFDRHWVLTGDTAQALLVAQGYEESYRQKRSHGRWWSLMIKEIQE